MENWKIAVIGVLFLSLLGFGIAQQKAETAPPPLAAAPIPAPPSPYLGKTLPPWNFKTWSGKPVAENSLAGHSALIEFFRIECSHCQAAAPFMVAIQKRYGPRGLRMVAIQSPGDFKDPENPENKWGDVSAWLKEKEINYPVAFDEKSAYFQGTVKQKVLNNDPQNLLYPTILLTDKTGKVDFGQTGHDVAKAIALALALEKRFPTSDNTEKNAASLTPWLKSNMAELGAQLEGNDAMEKSLRDDLAQRLKAKN